MTRDAVTPAGIRRESEFDAIADEVKARTHQWVAQLRRGDRSAARLEAVLHGLGSAVLDILAADDLDTLPDQWAAMLARYLEENFEDEEPGNDVQQGSRTPAEAADKKGAARPPEGGLVDKGDKVGRPIPHQSGNIQGRPGKLRKGETPAPDAPKRKKPGAVKRG